MTDARYRVVWEDSKGEVWSEGADTYEAALRVKDNLVREGIAEEMTSVEDREAMYNPYGRHSTDATNYYND